MEFTTGGGKNVQYGIEYEPKVEDPVVIKVYDTIAEAEAHMEMLFSPGLERIKELYSLILF